MARSRSTREANAGLLLVINGSPYERNKDDVRLDLVRRRAAEAGCTLAYVNMVGGQDELVFDGDSIVVGPDGTVLARAPQFDEGCLVVDLDLPAATAGAGDQASSVPSADRSAIAISHVTLTEQPVAPYEPVVAGIAPRLDDEAEVYGALVTGLRDYAGKNGFDSVVLGLSGRHRLGPHRGDRLRRPRRRQRARHLDAQRLLVGALAIRRRRPRASAPACTSRPCRSSRWSTPSSAQLELTGLAEENLQARVRGTLLMALSNQHGHLVLATGNKTELAVGYSTLYGDSVGGFAPLKDVPKTLVWSLARWRNKDAADRGETPPIPESSISKPPSAELRPGQLDTRLAARLRRARRRARRLRRAGPRARRAGRGRLRPRRWPCGC